MNIFELEKRIDEILKKENQYISAGWERNLLLMELSGIRQAVEALKPLIGDYEDDYTGDATWDCYQRILSKLGVK